MGALRGTWAIGLVVVVVACGGQAAPSASVDQAPAASPTQAAISTAEPAATATAVPEETPDSGGIGWAQDPPEPLLLDRAVRVVVDGLNLRERPSTSAKRLWTMPRNVVMGVGSFPPVDADGFTWYFGVALRSLDGELPPLPEDPHAVIDPIGGWFAVMKGSTRYVEPLAPRCPSAGEEPAQEWPGVDLRTLAVMLGAERLACFGDATITFEGTYGCRGCTPEFFGNFEPAWLANPNIVHLVREVGSGTHGFGMLLRFPPDGAGPPGDGSMIRVRGHLDDRAASTCEIAIDEPWGDIVPAPAPPSFARLWCRQMFVVEGYDVIGTDASFPTE